MARKVVCRIQKLSSRKQIKGHLRHGMRDDQPDNANPDRAHLNRKVGGTAEEVIARLDARLDTVDHKDAQAVELVEMVITAAADAFGKGKVKAQSFLSDALKFARERFGRENVIAAAAHYDEIAPHVHIYITPIHHVEAHTRKRSVFAGKDPVTGKQKRETREFEVPARTILSASHFFGSPKKLSQLQTDVYEAVGKPHGLDRGLKRSRATHTALKEFYGAIAQPVTPMPKPPEIGLSGRLNPQSLLDEYKVAMQEWAKPIIAKAKIHDLAKRDANRGEYWQQKAAEQEAELKGLNALLLQYQEEQQQADEWAEWADAQLDERAALIEQLQAENERLQAELKRHAPPDLDGTGPEMGM